MSNLIEYIKENETNKNVENNERNTPEKEKEIKKGREEISRKISQKVINKEKNESLKMGNPLNFNQKNKK